MSQLPADTATAQLMEQILYEVKRVVVGQDRFLERVMVAMLAQGHLLVEGVPGLAKTLTVKTLAGTIRGQFKRIQFTPDLVPADLVGTRIYNQKTGDFSTALGPVFANLLLADEINRAPAKTQSAMLEAMQELKVTVLGRTYDLQPPFFVLATQNPVEQEGTYPLPEAQLDRFMFLIDVDYPSAEEEKQIARSTTGTARPQLDHLLDGPKVMAFQALVRRVPVPDHLYDLAVAMVRKTRPGLPEAPAWVKDYVAWGAGPRAVQYLILGAKARAALQGRYMASLDDLEAVAPAVLGHRVITNFAAESQGMNSKRVVQRLIEEMRQA